ncbi:MAG TPA: redoxin domain-containing protein [Acidimicrobiales bacterium]|nr:redoxin domain-containing protein [Acidimicrobiales bacterium]
MILTPGTSAPDFTLPATPDKVVTLSEIDAPVVLIFYPADWSPVCGDELSIFEAAGQLFKARGAELLGISVDGVWCHSAFRADRKLAFPLLADFHPKGATATSYGVYRGDDGISERALFVLDRAHTITWSHLSPIGVNPGADGALRAVEALS